jgi:arylsulfatase A
VPASKGAIFHTPNLEKLAAQGMRFSAAYAPAPVCSPTRISLQTGKSPAQLHWTKAAPPESGHKLIEPQLIKSMSKDEITIADLLRKAGYATAHYGKWHISSGGPGQHGYDEHDGDTGNENAFKFVDPNPVDIFGMAERASAFMEKNSKAGKPFFIQLSWNALHASENANKATLAKYEKLPTARNPKQVTVAAITEDLDTGVGRVAQAIDRLGLSKNTLPDLYVRQRRRRARWAERRQGRCLGGRHSRSSHRLRAGRQTQLVVPYAGGRLRLVSDLLRVGRHHNRDTASRN